MSVLPILLKYSAFNNVALAKILQHFYNTRLSEIRIDLMEKHLVTVVRDLLKLYKSTTQLAIFLPHDHGGLGVKKLSFVYYTTRIAFLVKMLNHDVEKFSFIARKSSKLDMKKRKATFVGPQGRNFLGYKLDENGTLKCKTSFGCQSDWVDLLHYTRKIAVNLEYRNDKVIALKNGTEVKPLPKFQKALYNHCRDDLLTKTNDLSIQGSLFTLQNINRKCSNSFLFNWNINDDLYIFVVKARMSIFVTNFTLYLRDRQKNLHCSFGCLLTESVAHALNGCIHHFKNYYSRRHDHIISNFIKESI